LLTQKIGRAAICANSAGKNATFTAVGVGAIKSIESVTKSSVVRNVDLLSTTSPNGLEGFWSFAKERLIKFHGVSPEKFPFYLKEMEFRYNY